MRFAPPVDAAFFELEVDVNGKRAVVVDSQTSIASQLADLGGISADLCTVAKNCELIAKMARDGRKEDVVSALIDSAIIRYRRCFATGVRGRLPKDIVETHCPEYQDIADFFRTLADQHVAHSVSDMEHLICGIAITAYGTNDASFAAVISVNLAGEPALQNFDRLGELARLINDRYVEPEAQRFSELLENEMRAMSAATLNELPRLRKDIREAPGGVAKRAR